MKEFPFSRIFSGPEAMTSQPEVMTFWGRLGSFGIKSLYRENWGVQVLFLFPMAHWGRYYIYAMF